jgi:hypothetical protein
MLLINSLKRVIRSNENLLALIIEVGGLHDGFEVFEHVIVTGKHLPTRVGSAHLRRPSNFGVLIFAGS